MAPMKKVYIVVLFLLLITPCRVMCQRFSPDPNIELPVDEKLALYFDTFRDGILTQGASRFASYTVREFNIGVIPYLKDYIKDADYLHYDTVPQDVTLNIPVGSLYFRINSLYYVISPYLYTSCIQQYCGTIHFR